MNSMKDKSIQARKDLKIDLLKNIKTTKEFDLYSHMKSNIKNNSTVCEIHDSDFTTYCIPCRRAICEVCRDSYHTTHLFVDKNEIKDNNRYLIQLIFEDIEKKIVETDIFSQPKRTLLDVQNKINKEFDLIVEKAIELKVRRLKELESVFGIQTNDSKKLFTYIKKTKDCILTFLDSQKNFYCLKENEDTDNFSFLSLYDIVNESDLFTKEYHDLVNNIKIQFKKYETLVNNKYCTKIQNVIEECLEEQKKLEVYTSNMIVLDRENNEGIQMDNNLNFGSNKNNIKNISSSIVNSGNNSNNNLINMQNAVLNNINGLSNNISNSNNTNNNTDYFSNNATNNNSNMNSKNISSKKLPVSTTSEDFKNSLAFSYERLGEDLYEPLRNKLMQIVEHNETFKMNVHDSFKKTGSLIEIEKMLKIYEDKTSKRVQYNSQVNQVKISQSKGSGLTRSKNTLKISSVGTPEKKREIEDTKNKFDIQSKKVESIKEEDEDKQNERLEEDSQISFNNKDEQIDVGISKNKKLFENKELLRLNNMFKPKQKQAKAEKHIIQSLPTKKEESLENDEKFKNKLVDILKENQKLSEMIKCRDDCNLRITIIRKFYSYSILEFIRKNFYIANKNQSSHILFSKQSENSPHSQDSVKVFEGTSDIQIYDRDKRKIIRKTIKIDKRKFGTSVFHNGCRTFYCMDKLYISGGKDFSGEKCSFWSYDLKESKLEKLVDMNNNRSYHTMVYHENLRSLMVFGGENNTTCEMYDFYLNLWNPLPDMNFPRANVLIYLDKVGTFGYALCGITGSITNPSYSDEIELLDLVDMNQGWAIVDYNNKSNVDLRMNENRIYPLTDDKLLIYGAFESRTINKVYCIFDLRTFILRVVDEEELGDFKIQSILNPTKTMEKALAKNGLTNSKY